MNNVAENAECAKCELAADGREGFESIWFRRRRGRVNELKIYDPKKTVRQTLYKCFVRRVNALKFQVENCERKSRLEPEDEATEEEEEGQSMR